MSLDQKLWRLKWREPSEIPKYYTQVVYITLDGKYCTGWTSKDLTTYFDRLLHYKEVLQWAYLPDLDEQKEYLGIYKETN